MKISETIDGQVAITQDGVTVMLNPSEAFELLCWLADRRDLLYHESQHGDPLARYLPTSVIEQGKGEAGTVRNQIKRRKK